MNEGAGGADVPQALFYSLTGFLAYKCILTFIIIDTFVGKKRIVGQIRFGQLGIHNI